MDVIKPYDTGMKDLTERYGAELARGLLDVVGSIKVVDADLATVIAEADKVLRVTNRRGEPWDPWIHTPGAGVEPELTPAELSRALARWRKWLLHFEFQANADPDLVWRLLRYSMMLAHLHRVPIRSVAILLREQADHASLTGRSVSACATGIQEFRYEVVRVWQHEPDQFLDGRLGLLPLAPLSRVSVDALPGVIDSMQYRIDREATPEEGAHLWSLVGLLLGLRVDTDHGRHLLKGVSSQMRESSTYQWILQEGRDEGQTLGERNLLIRLATGRWGPPDAETQRRIDALTDPHQIEATAARLFAADGWSDLLA